MSIKKNLGQDLQNFLAPYSLFTGSNSVIMQALNLPLPGALVTKVGPEFRFIEINGTKQAEGPPVAMGTRVIEPKELWHILIGDSNQFPPDKWAVVDLRRKGEWPLRFTVL